eukprot:jgi/Mesvir1/5674/Mv15691-RA.1
MQSSVSADSDPLSSLPDLPFSIIMSRMNKQDVKSLRLVNTAISRKVPFGIADVYKSRVASASDDLKKSFDDAVETINAPNAVKCANMAVARVIYKKVVDRYEAASGFRRKLERFGLAAWRMNVGDRSRKGGETVRKLDKFSDKWEQDDPRVAAGEFVSFSRSACDLIREPRPLPEIDHMEDTAMVDPVVERQLSESEGSSD